MGKRSAVHAHCGALSGLAKEDILTRAVAGTNLEDVTAVKSASWNHKGGMEVCQGLGGAVGGSPPVGTELPPGKVDGSGDCLQSSVSGLAAAETEHFR